MRLINLKNARNTVVRLADWGATLLGVDVPHPDGIVRAVLGPADPARELGSFGAAGATVGRCANRIAGARFDLDGITYPLPANDGRHHLHGGPAGFAHVPWSYAGGDDREARFRLVSPDGDQGYPGRLEVSVTYRLSDGNALTIEYESRTDRPTPVNLTNHAYFNLAGTGDVLGHELWADADRYLPIDAEIIPTGEIAPVTGTPFDFREARAIGERIGALQPQPGGYDHCLVLRADRDRSRPCIRLSLANGLRLEIVTDQPAVQLYSGNQLRVQMSAGGPVQKYGGVCLETQHFPDAVHHPTFPTVILRPGGTFSSATTLEFRSDTLT